MKLEGQPEGTASQGEDTEDKGSQEELWAGSGTIRKQFPQHQSGFGVKSRSEEHGPSKGRETSKEGFNNLREMVVFR